MSGQGLPNSAPVPRTYSEKENRRPVTGKRFAFSLLGYSHSLLYQSSPSIRRRTKHVAERSLSPPHLSGIQQDPRSFDSAFSLRYGNCSRHRDSLRNPVHQMALSCPRLHPHWIFHHVYFRFLSKYRYDKHDSILLHDQLSHHLLRLLLQQKRVNYRLNSCCHRKSHVYPSSSLRGQ